MQTLILSNSWCSTARVESRLLQLGHQPVRVETDRFPRDLHLSMRADGSLRLRDSNRDLVLEDPEVVWYRRIAVSPDLPADVPAQLRQGVTEELRSFLHGLLARCRRVMDPKARLAQAERKPRQLALAAEQGLDVPATLCTTDADLLRSWAAALGRPLVTKVFSSFAVQDQGQQKVVHTTALSEQDLQELEGLEWCPVTVQERLEKAREYRVTVVGRRLFTVSVNSAVAGGEVDWRRVSDTLRDAWREDTLPEDAASGLLRLMDRLGLNYGAADFVRTPDGRCVFLEVNPAGEYLWIDDLLDGRISEAIAEHLAGLHPWR